MKFNDHPGLCICEYATSQGVNMLQLALALGFDADRMKEMLDCTIPIDQELADRLEYLFDIPAAEWLKVQERYEELPKLEKRMKRLNILCFIMAAANIAFLYIYLGAGDLNVYDFIILYCLYFSINAVVFIASFGITHRDQFQYTVQAAFAHWGAYLIPFFLIHFFHC